MELQVEPGTSDSGHSRPLERALRDLGFAVKSLQLYPPTSPIVERAVSRSHGSIVQLLDKASLKIEVNPRSFRAAGESIGDGAPLIEQLAEKMHRHGIARLHVDRNLAARSLEALSQLIAMGRNEVNERGGLERLLHDSRLPGIRVEFLQLDRLFGGDAVGAPQAGERKDVWQLLLDGYEAGADDDETAGEANGDETAGEANGDETAGEATAIEENGENWENLVGDISHLEGFVNWVAENVDRVAEQSDFDNVEVLRFAVERIGSVASRLGDEHVNFLPLAMRQAFDQMDPDTLMELLAEPLEVEAAAAGAPDEGESEERTAGQSLDVTKMIAQNLDTEQAERLIHHALLNEDESSARLYGLFSRLTDGRDDRAEIVDRVRDFIGQEDSQHTDSFLSRWPKLVKVLNGEAPQRFVNPEYGSQLQQLTADASAAIVFPVEDLGPVFSHDMQASELLRRKASVVVNIMQSEGDDEHYAALVKKLAETRKKLLDDRQYDDALTGLQALVAHGEAQGGRSEGQRRLASTAVAEFYEAGAFASLLRDAVSGDDVPPVVASFIDLSPALAVPALFHEASKKRNGKLRTRLLRLLAERGEQAMKHLIERLADENPAYIRRLIGTTGDLRAPGLTGKLAPAMQHPEKSVRLAAAGAIVRLGGESAEPLLLDALNDESSEIRLAAIHGLGYLGKSEGVAALSELLSLPNLTGRNNLPIVVAAIALGRLGAAHAQPTLRALTKPWLFTAWRKPVRQAAEWALRAVSGDGAGRPPEPAHLAGLRPRSSWGSEPADGP